MAEADSSAPIDPAPETQSAPEPTAGEKRRAMLNSLFSLLLAGAVGYIANSIWMPGTTYRDNLQPLSANEKLLSANLKAHVQALASDIGERNFAHYEKLKSAEDYVEKSFVQAGFAPEQIKSQIFRFNGQTFRNIEVEISGGKKSSEIIVIGAHFDTAPGTPGADDNASGIAATLELARLLKARRFQRTIRLVGFTNEEPPHFFHPSMGSYHYAERSRKLNENIVGMMALETMGTYKYEVGSQHYPVRGGTWFYPNRGNFIAFVSSSASGAFVRECVGTFRRVAQFPSEGLAAPSYVVAVELSDHWCFEKFGYPGLMVTDTAPFRIDTYHQPNDLPDTLNYDDMARVVAGLDETIAELALELPDHECRKPGG